MVWFGGSWVLDLGSHSWSLSCNPLCDLYSILRHTTLQVGLSWVDLTTNSITVLCATLLQLQISADRAGHHSQRETQRKRETARDWERGQGRAGQGRAEQSRAGQGRAGQGRAGWCTYTAHLRRDCSVSQRIYPPMKTLLLIAGWAQLPRFYIIEVGCRQFIFLFMKRIMIYKSSRKIKSCKNQLTMITHRFL